MKNTNSEVNTDKIDMMLQLMESDELLESEEDWIVKLEAAYERKNTLSEREFEILEDIFNKAAGRVEWSRDNGRR